MSYETAIRERYEVHEVHGDELVINCPDPEHSDDHPSAWVNVAKGVWICYACGEAGHLADLVDGESVEQSSDEILSETKRLLDRLEHPPRPYPEAWLNQFERSWRERYAYWRKRGLGAWAVKDFRLGLDPSFTFHEETFATATIPMRDEHGLLWGVIRRRLDGMRPKYLYPPDVDASQMLFALDRLTVPVSWQVQTLVLTEGPLDAIAMIEAGYPAVAQYGSTLSDVQRDLLATRVKPTGTLVVAYDQDEPGRKHAREFFYGSKRRPPRDLTMSWTAVAVWDPEEGKDLAELSPSRRRSVIEQAWVPDHDGLPEELRA